MPLTSEGLCSRKASGRVGAHDAKDVVVILSEAIKQKTCKPTLPKVGMDNELSDSAHCFVPDFPSTGKSIPC